MSEQNSTFTTEGFKPFPSLYQDNQQVREFSAWTTESLNSHYQEYNEFLQTKVMPRAEEESRRIMAHLCFELMYREGMFGE